MSDIPDAIGAVVDGAALARAVEPAHGERDGRGHFHETACLNCGAVLTGPHCSECGQAAHLHRTMAAFLHDLLHGVLHLEGKTWRTLPLLAWKPGELTRRYIEGERARFVSPMAMFLFSVFLMFAVFQLAGISAPSDINPAVSAIASDDPAQARKQLDGLKQARAEMSDDNPAAPILDEQIAQMNKELAADQAKADKGEVVLAQSTDRKSKITGHYSGVGFLDHGVDKWRENPGLMAYKLQASAYKFSWLPIPLSVPFVWLIFAWKRRYGLYDHAVFVTYSIAFMSLLFIVLTVASQLGLSGGWISLAATTIPVLHLYRQLRGAYQLSRFSAAWRTILLLGVIFAVLTLFFALLLLMGVAG